MAVRFQMEKRSPEWSAPIRTLWAVLPCFAARESPFKSLLTCWNRGRRQKRFWKDILHSVAN